MALRLVDGSGFDAFGHLGGRQAAVTCQHGCCHVDSLCDRRLRCSTAEGPKCPFASPPPTGGIRWRRAPSAESEREQGSRGDRRISDHGKCTHTAERGLPSLVPGRHRQSPAGRERSGEGLAGDPTVRFRAVGAHGRRDGRPHQGDRDRERLLPPPHPRVLLPARGQPRRGLRARAVDGHARRRQGARGEARDPAHLRDRHRRVHGEVGQLVPRPAAAAQPVVQRDALRAAHPPVPALLGVPVAGGAHRPRDL